jgi:thiamine biosynthesis protein ThiS
MINVIINGEAKVLEHPMTISSLLSTLQLNSRAVAVELNEEIQPRDRHHQLEVVEGDVLEIVSLVGGG